MKKTTFSFKSALMLMLCVAMCFMFAFSSGAEEKEHTHILGEWEITLPATCQANGVKQRACLVEGCDFAVTEVVLKDVTNHIIDETSWEVDVPESCENPGRYKAKCLYCATGVEYKYTEALGHSFSDDAWEIIKESVCVKGEDYVAGVRQQKCSTCHYVITENYDAEHEWQPETQWVLLSQATCTKPAAYNVACKNCGHTKVVLGTELAPHTFTGEAYYITAPTCTEDGVGIDTCDVCKEIIVGMTIPADEKYHEFDFNDMRKNELGKPYFNTRGFNEFACKHCIAYVEVRYEEYCNHNFITEDNESYSFYKPQIKANASCTSEGIIEKYCLDCKKYIALATPKQADGHDFGETVVLKAPTCTEKGLQMTCCNLNYGHVFFEDIEPTGHSFREDEWETVKHATCDENGLELRYCKTCKADIEREIVFEAAEGVETYENRHHHKIDLATENVIKQATCTETGLVEYFCSLCKETITFTLPEHYSTLIANTLYKDTEPTCYVEGSKHFKCKLCSEEITEIIPLDLENGHSYSVETNATCKEEGTLSCLRSKRHAKTYSDFEAHVWGDWTVDKKATCTEDGQQTHTCTLCGTSATETIKANGHTPGKLVNTAGYNCVEGGYKALYCANCPAHLENQYVAPVKSHTITTGWYFVNSDENCKTGGIVARNCDKCSYRETKVTKPGEHIAYIIIDNVPATCTAGGYDNALCVCSAEIKANETAPNGHKWTTKISGIEPSCTLEGLEEVKFCIGCNGLSGGEILPALGHDFVPSETEGVEGTCSRCGIHSVGTDEEGETVTCDCMCHSDNFIVKIYYKIVTFFNKLIGRNQLCECGAVHYEKKAK